MSEVAQQADLFTGLYRVGEPRRAQAITYQVEPLAAIRAEMPALLERHFDEIAQFPAVQVLDPDWGAYAALEAAGKLWIMTVRDRGDLVGYISMVITRNLHYKNLLHAGEDVHYVLPEYRKGMTGYRLIRKARDAMKARGAQLMTMRTKAAKSHAPLLERAGGQLSDLSYTFVL